MNPIRFQIGSKKNSLTIIKPSNTRINNKRTWLCRCDCGNERIVTTNQFSSGYIKSCGCQDFKSSTGKNSNCWKGYEEISGAYFSNIRNNATKRNLIFKLSIKDVWLLFIKQNRKCALSGRELFFPISISKFHRGDYNASLDRIDSSKGYTKNNIQWVHKDINYMKQDFSDEYFINFCKEVSCYHKNKS